MSRPLLHVANFPDKKQFSFVTTPVTNDNFRERVTELATKSCAELQNSEIPSCHPDPIVPPLTTEDTSLFPGHSTSGLIAYSSPWIDLCSDNPAISSISRQVLNLEVAYANFCGVRTIIFPGPRQDAVKAGNSRGLAQYARAIQETLLIGTRMNFVIHLPMYREPGLEEATSTLSSELDNSKAAAANEQDDIDIFSSWDSWHLIRSTCDYDSRLFVGMFLPIYSWISVAMGHLLIHSFSHSNASNAAVEGAPEPLVL